MKPNITIPSDTTIFDIADLFKVLGDSTRVKILSSLQNEPLCVNDICLSVKMTKSAVSHQLRILRSAKLVKNSKVGKRVYYSFDDEHVTKIFLCALEHINEER